MGLRSVRAGPQGCEQIQNSERTYGFGEVAIEAGAERTRAVPGARIKR